MFRELITEATVKDPTNILIKDAFRASNYVKGTLSYEEDRNSFRITLKETEPQSSWGKINETQVEKLLKTIGATAKFGLRDMAGKGWYSSAVVSELGDYTHIGYSGSKTSKYLTTVFTFN